MGIFIDTSYYYGLINEQDKYHSRAKQLFKSILSKYGQVFTSPYILAETSTLIAVRNPSHATEFLEKIQVYFIGNKKIAKLLNSNEEIVNLSWEMMKNINRNAKTPKDIVSFVDCMNIVLCKKHQVDYIASFDHHFDPYLRRIK
jgi:predicted nucleic acid-binding protein